MSKILFINPVMESALGVRPYDSKLMKAIWGGRSAFIPKLVGMIIAALTPEKYTFQYIDEDVDEIDYESDADLVVITCMTVQAIRTYEISGEFRKRGKTVIIGGIHAAVMTEEVLAHCDVAMIGECENTWPVMLEDFENGRLKRLYDAKEFPPVEQLISPKVDIINPRKFLYYPIQ
ncbi:MAG: cobalamin-dependent protein, partial [Clostridiales bacterium]|nr:cobalamin-dependent protein [Clostridiales bacterium]